MKKYISVLFILMFTFSSLGINVNSANAINCASGSGEKYNTTTGQPCPPSAVSSTSGNSGSSSQSSSIDKIAPAVIKKIKLLPDLSGNVPSENLSSGSLTSLGLTNYATGEIPGLVIDAAYMNWWKNSAGSTCKDGDETCFGNGTVPPGNLAGARYFSLDDPMNPTMDTSKIWNISFFSGSEDYKSDPAGDLHVLTPIFSQDGEYSKVTSNGGAVASISQGNSSHTHMRGGGLSHKGFIQSGGYTYLVSQDQIEARFYNVTNFDSSRGYIYANQNPSQTPYFQAMPSFAPKNLGPGQIALLGGDKFAYFSFDQATGATLVPSVKFYSITKPSLLAKANLPSNIGLLGGVGSSDNVGGFNTPDGAKYAYIFAGTDPNKKFYLYKLSSDEKSVIKIVEGISLDQSQFTPKVVGMSVAGNRAIMTFNRLANSVGSKDTAPHIYLLSDLAQNVKKDIYTGPSPILGVANAVSYISNTDTYVYTAGLPETGDLSGHSAYVIKFDASSINADYPPGGDGNPPPPPSSAAPAITSLFPSSGLAGSTFSINGYNFGSSGTINFGSSATPYTGSSGSSVSYTVPLDALATYGVTITNDKGISNKKYFVVRAPISECTPVAGSIGCVKVTPATSRNGQSFTIKLTGLDIAGSIPDSTVTRLWSDNGEIGGSGGYKDFGNWFTVGELKAGVTRTLDCKAYTSYLPGETTDITDKQLNQKMYLVYGTTGKQSGISFHSKDCRTSTTPKPSSVPWYIKYLIQ